MVFIVKRYGLAIILTFFMIVAGSVTAAYAADADFFKNENSDASGATVSFSVQSGEIPVFDAKVDIYKINLPSNNYVATKTTDSEGRIQVSLSEGPYVYEVSKDGYAKSKGIFFLNGDNISETVDMFVEEPEDEMFGMAFMVRNEGGSMNDATINIYKVGSPINIMTQRLSTDFSGKSKFILENNTPYYYTVTAPGHEKIAGVFKMSPNTSVIQIFLNASIGPSPSEDPFRTFVFYIRNYADMSNSRWYTGVGANASMALMNALSINFVDFDFDYDNGKVTMTKIDDTSASDANTWHPFVYNESAKKWDVLEDIDSKDNGRIYALTFDSSSTKQPDGKIQEPYWFFLQWDDRAKWIAGTSYDPTSAFTFACEDAKIPLLLNITNGDFRGWIGHIMYRGITLAEDKETWIYWVTYNIDKKGKWEFSNYVSGNLPEVHYFAYVFGHSFGNNTRTTPTTPLRPGYMFKGYFKDPEFTQPYDFETLPTKMEDMVDLYVKWEEGNEPSPIPSETNGPTDDPEDPMTMKVVRMNVPKENVSLGEKVTIPVNVEYAHNLSKFGIFIHADPDLAELKLNRSTPEMLRIPGAFHNGNYNFTTREVRYSFMSRRAPVSGDGTILYIDVFPKKPDVSIPFKLTIEEMVEDEKLTRYRSEVSGDLRVNPYEGELPPVLIVVNGNGKQVENADVSIYREEFPENILLESKKTKSNGEAEFNLSPGSYIYVVSADGFYNYSLGFDVENEPVVLPVDLTSSEFMPNSSKVTFEVKGTKGDSDIPLKNANVTMYNVACPKNAHIKSVMTDDSGKSSFILKKYAPYIYVISMPGYPELNGTVVPNSSDYTVPIHMGSYVAEKSTVTFNVTFEKKAVSDADIVIYKSGPETVRISSLKTDSSGKATTDLDFGVNYLCTVQSPGLSRSCLPFTPSKTHSSVNVHMLVGNKPIESPTPSVSPSTPPSSSKSGSGIGKAVILGRDPSPTQAPAVTEIPTKEPITNSPSPTQEAQQTSNPSKEPILEGPDKKLPNCLKTPGFEFYSSLAALAGALFIFMRRKY